MKVRETTNKPANLSGMSGKEDRKVSDTRETSFQSQLKRVESRSFEDRVNEMVDKITEQGEKLGKKADLMELKIYKNMISEFMDEIVKNSHKFSKQNHLDKRGRYKVYAMVKKVNSELDLLAKDVLNTEKDNLEILKRIDDIRGLVLDMTM